MKKLFLVYVSTISVLMLVFAGSVENISAQLGTAGSGRTETTINMESAVKRKSKTTSKHKTPKRVVRKKTALDYENLGEQFYNQKDYDSAIVAFQNAVRLNPKLPLSNYRLSWLHNEFGEYDKALLVLNKAIPISTSAPPKTLSYMYFEKGYAHRQLNQTNDAISAFKQAVSLNPQYASAYYELGAMYNDMKMYNEAVSYLRLAINNRADYAEAYEELGVAQRKLGRNSEAIISFNQSISLDPNDSGAYMGLGDVYFSGTKEYQKAINAYLKGLQIDGDNHVACYNVGWSYNELENYNEALRWLNQAARLKPEYVSTYVEIGYAYYKQHLDSQAISAYQKALQYKPDYASAYFGIADVYYYNLKNYQLAADNLKKGLVYKPDSTNPIFQLGYCYEQLQNFPLAIEQYKKYLTYKPESSGALYRLGFCYNDLKRYQEGLDVLLRARQIEPTSENIQVELGYSYMMLRRFNEAVQTFRQAIGINKDNQLAHYYLGQTYLYNGNRNGAANELRELQRLNSKYAAELKKMIENR